MDRYNSSQGWYNQGRFSAPNMPPSNRQSGFNNGTSQVEKRVFKLKSFIAPSVIMCILGACSLALGITNLVVSSTAYYTDPITKQATPWWAGCSANASSIVAPNNATRGSVFWLFACIGVVIGLWCLVLGLWSAFAAKLSNTVLKVLYRVLLITFLGCLVQATFATIDLAASFSCLSTENMDLNANIKVSMPVFLVVLASLQLIVAGFLYNLVGSLSKIRGSQSSRKRLEPSPAMRYNNNNFGNSNYDNDRGFDNWMGVGRPSPYTNFQRFGK